MKTPLDRRSLLRRAAAFGLAAATPVSGVTAALSTRQLLDPAKLAPRDALLIWAKLRADLAGRTLFSITTGAVWGFRPQADDLALSDFARRLYGYATCIATRGAFDADDNVVLQTRSWNFYLDPETDLPTTRLYNPYTAKRVESAPMFAPARRQTYSVTGPAVAPQSVPLETLPATHPYDLRIRVLHPHAFVTDNSFIRFKPADASWFKLEGNLWSHACLLSDLQEGAGSFIPSTWSQNLVAEWQTWMQMHGSPGHILFKGEGAHVDSIERIPPDLRRSIDNATPGALAETLSWR